jgi:hypothetical protein
MLHARNIPQDWIEALDAVRHFSPKGAAVLGGGALRDLALGAPVKDLDIFVEASMEELMRMRDRMTDALAGSHADCRDEGDEMWSCVVDPFSALLTPGCYIPTFRDEVTSVLTVHGLADLEVQIIALNVPAIIPPVVERLDAGLCQIGFDGTLLHATAAFYADVRDRTFTVLNAHTEAQMERSRKRYERIREKHPGLLFRDGRRT